MSYTQNNKNSKKTVVAIGKFDGVHIGHKKLLQKASDIACAKDFLSLCFIITLPGGHTLLTVKKREALIKKAGINNCYIQNLDSEFMSMSAEDFVAEILIKKLNCAHVVVGYNFRFAKNRAADADDLKRICSCMGIDCTVIDEVTITHNNTQLTVSSSNIRKFIEHGDVKSASHLLDRNYSLAGTVIHGKKLGRTIDFPTANITVEKHLIIPQSGVYATLTHIGDKNYNSITNIGNNPTVDNDGLVKVENHVIGFNNDIYGEVIEIEFLYKIRDEIKFSSIDELKLQIKKDVEFIK